VRCRQFLGEIKRYFRERTWAHAGPALLDSAASGVGEIA
jgi:hypothetical protein